MTTTTRPGFSDAAKAINEWAKRNEASQDETITFSNLPLGDQLIEVHETSSQPGWDGEGSHPVTAQTLAIAQSVVESLPRAYRTPEISGEPDGRVLLEWYVHPRQILNVSVDASGRLHWAALVGSEDPRGSCQFYGDAPKTLLHWLGRVCPA